MLNNFEIFLKKKYFVPLRTLNSFTKSLVSPFIDIASTFFDSSSKSFSTSACFVLCFI